MRNTNNTTDASCRDKAMPCLYWKSKSRNSLGRVLRSLQAKNGFTLVELLVVITILAILGALAFTQMGSFQWNARDSDRVTTLSQLDSWLELYQIKIWSYPTPEANASWLILTGSIDGTVYAKLWVIGDNISTNVRMNKTPVDPASLDKYVYATDSTQSHYQIAATLENAISYKSPLIPQVHAATPAQARVNGNYPGYIKFLSGTTTYIANVPSLIWYATGASISLTANPTTTYFVVNKQNNLPYKFNSTDTIQNQNADQILQSVTGYSTATLILTGITSLTATGIEAQFWTSATLSPALASFGWDLTKLTTALLGTTATTGSTPTATNWACWSANGTPVATAPTTNLCTAGTPTAVVGTGPWTWSCTGIDGGTTASCSANVLVPVYSSATTYTAGQSFTYTLPSGSTVTVSVTGPGYGTVAGTKTLHTPACDTDDIAIWQNGTTNVQIWAACNLGASVAVPYASSATVVAGNVTPDATEKTRIGNLYQWGNKADITSAGTSGTQVACTNVANAYNTATFITGFSDWCSTASTDNRWGNTDNTSTARQWPCPTGYHVPSGGTTTTTTEWGTAYVIANNMSTLGTCDQTGTTPPYDRLRCAMMIPLSGFRNYSDGSFNNQGTNSYYWSSSPYTSNGCNAGFNAGGGVVADNVGRAYGFSVRCLKN